MNTIKRILRSIVARPLERIRTKVKEERKAKLKNPNPTIISNNCIAGAMYHDLDLRFTSPTINLFFYAEDYFEFLMHLEHYLQSVPVETVIEGIAYPVGLFSRGDRQITAHFMHYTSFENASQKWVERAKRVDLNNLYIVFEHPSPCTDDDPWLHRFLSLPFEHKLMFTDCRKLSGSYDHVIHMPVYEGRFTVGKIVKRSNIITCQRYLDDYDYASFLSE